MKANLLILSTLFSLFSFRLEAHNASELDYQLRSLVRSFATSASKESCDNYFQNIETLQDNIKEAIENAEEGLQELKDLQKRTKAFYEFAATLTRCKGTSNEVSISYFNTFINETALSPVLIKKSDCVAVYKVNMNGFQTYYAVNAGKAKSVKIAVKKGDQYNSSSSTYTMNIMCNSVEGFAQGEAQGKINSMAVTCSPLNSQYLLDCE